MRKVKPGKLVLIRFENKYCENSGTVMDFIHSQEVMKIQIKYVVLWIINHIYKKHIKNLQLFTFFVLVLVLY